ncbi:Essential recombination function protein [uncultured Caudovirales phage]|uniref:Essential recombination function protein n=1 Tax=uncultured Caudovirales phage TaxID=2100421 RepID=A0A6J5T2R9_9CAUD|nr:Essential recombination function protein [uncultured Caudovirales phage]CAB4221958.1 Essential recombination function protein [uncultured Caudovirales phage]
MKEIAAAFNKAQKAFMPVIKNAENPYFGSRYADLGACIQAVIGSLNDNGIALVQHTSESDKGVIVHTTFLHESGEIMETGSAFFPAIQNTPQAFGSALTYARRYSLMAACGIAPEDDDGQSASTAKPKQHIEPNPQGYGALSAPHVGQVEWEPAPDPWKTHGIENDMENTAEVNPIAPHCSHGLRVWKQGSKNGKDWAGFACPEPDRNNQCQMFWYVFGSDGKWRPQP